MRLIDGDALLEAMIKRKDFVGRLSDPVCLVQDAPTIDAELVKHSYWEVGFLDWICSNCEYDLSRLDRPQYCPGCGARMDGDELPKEKA